MGIVSSVRPAAFLRQSTQFTHLYPLNSDEGVTVGEARYCNSKVNSVVDILKNFRRQILGQYNTSIVTTIVPKH